MRQIEGTSVIYIAWNKKGQHVKACCWEAFMAPADVVLQLCVKSAVSPMDF